MLPAMMEARQKQRTPSPAQAMASLERRKLARSNFLEFCTFVDPKFDTPPHIRLVASKLQEVALFILSRGEKGIGRLMILMPPRHGKSELASRNFPAWLLGLAPDSRVILTSYGADLAVKNSRALRELVMNQRYQALFGNLSTMKERAVELSSDSRSAQAWDLAQPHKGGVVAAGVGGGITGLGADLLILDDPFKNREEAESESRRDLVDDWYRSSAHTRLSPHGAVVLFHTRWHPDDLAGRLTKKMMDDPQADQWEIVMLPSLALDAYADSVAEQRKRMRDGVFLPLCDPLKREAGKALWIGQFDEEWLRAKRSNIGQYDFEALYQQMPYGREGQKYKSEWFKKISKLPDGVKILFIVRYWDKANSSKGDFTAGVLMAYCSDGYFYIMDVARIRGTAYERDQKILKTSEGDCESYGKVYIWHQQDPGSAGKDSAEATNRLLVGYPAKFEVVTGDKESRSYDLESAFQGGLVFLLQGGWNEAFIDECLAFPRGRYDDQVDAASSAFHKLLKLTRKGQKEVKSYQG